MINCITFLGFISAPVILAIAAKFANCQGADLVCTEDQADLPLSASYLVPRHTELHLPAVHLCAQELSQLRGDHGTLATVNAEAEIVHGIHQKLCVLDALLVGSGEKDEVVDTDR